MVFTGWVVAWSVQQGKLAVPPDYDDSHSMVEGAVRLLNLKSFGPAAAWDEYRLRNTHSFLHYYYTSALYGIFGIRQSVVYWANGLFLFGVLVSFASYLPTGRYAYNAIWVAAFLGIPVAFHLVHDFRSEVTMAALIFIGCASAVAWSWSSKPGLWRPAATAIAFALALGMKPVMFPYTLGMLGLCSINFCFVRALSARWQAPAETVLRVLWRALPGLLGKVSLLWALVVIPNVVHFWAYSRFIFAYIWSVAFASDFYKLQSEQGAQWTFHWLGYSGVWHLSVLNVFFVIVVALGLILCCIPRLRNHAPEGKWLSLIFLTVGSFFGIAINGVHQPFFGMTFQLLLVASALSALAQVFSKPIPLWIPPCLILVVGYVYINPALNRAILIPAILVALAAGGICAFMKTGVRSAVSYVCCAWFALLCWKTTERAPYHNYVQRTISEAGEAGLDWRRSGPLKVYDAISGVWTKATSPIIWSSAYGWVDGRSIAWEAVLRGRAWMAFNESELPEPLSGDIPLYADFLLIQEPGVLGSIKTPQSHDYFSRVEDLLKEHPGIKQVAKVKDPGGKMILILRNDNASTCFKQGPEWLSAAVAHGQY